jgi:hypothetical protein
MLNVPNGAADVAQRLVGSQARSGARFGDACSRLRAQNARARARPHEPGLRAQRW